MKTKIILYFAALCLLAASCGKNDSVGLSVQENHFMKVCLPADALSKAYFPDENSGNLYWRNEYIFLVGVPVDGDGTLRFDLAVKTGNGGGYGGSSWSSGDTSQEEYERNRLYVYYVDKSPHDFFTQFDKCRFFLMASGDNWWGNQYWRHEMAGSSSFWNYADWVNLQIAGEDQYFMKSAVSQVQYDYRVNESDSEYYLNYSHCQTICGCSDVLTEQDIVENGNYAVTFPVLRLSNALLKFNIQIDGGTPIMMRNMRISLKNDADHSGDTDWYHALSGETFTDFSGYLSNQYTMYSIPQLEKLYPGENDLTGYYTSDYVLLGWSNDSWNATEDITLSSTPTDRWFYACVIPQSEYIDENSYLLFEAMDVNGTVLSSVKKTLPEGGFQAGTRYDFTLTLPSVHSDMGAVDAGKYDTVRDW